MRLACNGSSRRLISYSAHFNTLSLPSFSAPSYQAYSPIMIMSESAPNGISHSVQKDSTGFGRVALDKILETTLDNDAKSKHPLVLQSFRLLIADLCQQFGGGHPGSVLSRGRSQPLLTRP